MPIPEDSFFRLFNSDVRSALRRFFGNRNENITAEMAAEFTDANTLSKLRGLELLSYDDETSEYHLDDRVDRFFGDMLGTSEVTQADWLNGILDELQRLINGHQTLTGSKKSAPFLQQIAHLLRTCDSRAQRHLEDIKSAVDFDYRAGSDYEVKLMKLQWHLERARNYGAAIAVLDARLRNETFFQVQQNIEILSLRHRLINRCLQVGDALIDVYQHIEEYLNRIQRDYQRARKLIRLRGLIERHEHLSATNIDEQASMADGPWFREFRFRTLIEASVIDYRPGLLKKILLREGLSDRHGGTRSVTLQEHKAEEIPPVIDWQQVFETFSRQQDDLYVFLSNVRIDGRPMSEEERIDGFCSILCNENWEGGLEDRPFSMAIKEGWEYAVVTPSAAVAP